jgi:fructose-1,6-bisphosphatase/inositol monophosphatase family enzyme
MLAQLVMTEAGGVITDLKGQPITPTSESYIAANLKLHGLALKHFCR